MLEVTLLKVEHAGEEQAKKLLPYIQSCDVYSLESAHTSEDKALWSEDSWIDCLNKSKSKLINSLNKKSDIDKFIVRRYDYLHRNRKPLIYLERWSNESLESLSYSSGLHDTLFDKGMLNLKKGNFSLYLDNISQSVDILINLIKQRDKNIARHIEGAEKYLRSKYSFFDSKENINLTIELGAVHHPENYTTHPIKVNELVDENSHVPILMRNFYNVSNSKEYSERDLLAYGLTELGKDKLSLTEKECVKSGSIDEIKKFISIRTGI